MATVKLKFRASSVETKEGVLYYQIIHNRLARQIQPITKCIPQNGMPAARELSCVTVSKGVDGITCFP